MSELSQRALERRLKRHLLKAEQRFLAVCAPRFEPYLEEEVRALPDVKEVETVRGGVLFSGPLETMYHANLHLRTAHRVLLRIGDFLAQAYPVLFDRARRISWELYLGFAETFDINVSAKRSRLRHHKNIAATLYDAISSSLGPLGLELKLEDGAGPQLYTRMFRDRCTLSLNTSGEHLHKRGYRTDINEAPLRETLAASILKASSVEDYDLILDPMCGTGTFLIETALMKRRVAPGLERSFAFEQFPSFQKSKWERFKSEARDAALPQSSARLIGCDIDEEALNAARANAARAGVLDDIHFFQADARTLDFSAFKTPNQRALLVTNPPYGRRLGSKEEVKHLCRALSERLRQAEGWNVTLITSEPDWVELPLTSALEFRNGGLRVSLLQSFSG